MGMGRTSSRVASRRIAATHAAEKAGIEEEDDELDDDDWVLASKARRPGRRKVRLFPNQVIPKNSAGNLRQ